MQQDFTTKKKRNSSSSVRAGPAPPPLSWDCPIKKRSSPKAPSASPALDDACSTPLTFANGNERDDEIKASVK